MRRKAYVRERGNAVFLDCYRTNDLDELFQAMRRCPIPVPGFSMTLHRKAKSQPGLRPATDLHICISEALALRWADLDWLGSRLSVQRGIVERVVDDVKTEGSAKTFTLVPELVERLKVWKQVSEFAGADDWIFASPLKHGKLPYSYTGVWRELQRAATAAGIGALGTHAFRHTHRSWLSAVGTKPEVQQKMMRHSDIRTTFNIYGDVVTDEMITASGKVAQLAFLTYGAQNGAQEP